MDARMKELAPITSAAWEEIESEARATLKNFLAARKLVDFRGPLGAEVASVGTGRVREIAARTRDRVRARLRLAQPLVELEVTCDLQREELEAIDRGAKDADLGPLIHAARELALAEDEMVFHGMEEAHCRGICEPDTAATLTIGEDYEEYPRVVAEALRSLDEAGIGGPYAIALGPRCYAGLWKTLHPGGRAMIDFVRKMVEGPVVKAHALDGAVVLSMRGGDFEIVSGQDIRIAWLGHDVDVVRLALRETLAFLVHAPEAAVWLRHES